MPEEAKPAPVPGDPPQKEFALPILQRPQLVLDEASGMVWIGLPLAHMGKLEACVHLDQVKAHLLAWQKRAEKRPKLALPGAVRSSLNRILGRA